MAGQRLRCWPTLKSIILKYSPIFQVSDNLRTTTEIKHENYMQISPISRVSPRKMRKHHGTWRFGFSAAHNLRAAHNVSGGSGGMLPLEIVIRKLLYMHFGGS